MKRARIVLADDHELLTDAIKNMLQPEYDVVGTFLTGDALVKAVPEIEPDVIIIDVSMPMMNGLIACEQLKKMLPKVKIIFLTMNEDIDTVAEAFQSGASGYVLKTSAAAEL